MSIEKIIFLKKYPQAKSKRFFKKLASISNQNIALSTAKCNSGYKMNKN